MIEDAERCYRAVQSKDPRFDGWFVTAVTSTGIYCRPSCPAMTPKRAHVRFFATAAAAQQAGFRACKRCRPDASPGSPEWDTRADAVGRAMRLIADGVVDRDGVGGLAARLGYSRRQLERLLVAAVGTGPLALARAQRAQTARVLIETTGLPMAHVAFAAGFASIRQFNSTVQAVFATTPSGLRARAVGSGARGERAGAPARSRGPEPAAGGAVGGPASRQTLVLRLPYRPPLAVAGLFGHLAATSVPGVEEVRDGAYRRTLRLPHGPGVVALRPAAGHVQASLTLADLRDLGAAAARCRRLLDLDADPEAVDAALASDPRLAPLVTRTPGCRVPRTVDEAEMAVRVVLGQQVSSAAARTHAARLVSALGEPVDDPAGGLGRLFPTPDALAGAPGPLLGGPRRRQATVAALAAALADGTLSLGPGADWGRARIQLAAIPGIGPWTAETIAMRALGDPDAFPAGDLGVRRAAGAAGLPASPAPLTRESVRWRPWRSYAVQALWATLDHPINRFPPAGPPPAGAPHPDGPVDRHGDRPERSAA